LIDDVYELTLAQVDRGQTVNNVFFYHQQYEFVTTLPTHAQVLAEEWRDQILPAIRAFQPAEILTTGVRVRNLFNVSDGYDLALSLAGLGGAAEQYSTFNAVGFALNGDNPAVKNGAKRFTGINEVHVDDGVISGAVMPGLLNNVADALEQPVLVGLVIEDPVFVPVIVKRVREGVPGSYTYRLPETTVEAVLSQVVVAVWNAIITSQLSRKIGVGI
jgi:hypothetical protein